VELNVLLIVLGAAFLHAFWNAVAKSTGDPLINISGILTFGSFFALLILPFLGWPNSGIWLWVLASVFIHMCYAIALSYAYQSGDYSLAYPVARGMAPVFIAMASLLFLSDKVSVNQWVGIVGILAGVGLYSFHRFEQMLGNKRTILFSILTAFFIASYSILDGLASRAAEEPLQYIFYSIALEFIPILIYTRWRRGPQTYHYIASNWRVLAPSGVISAIAFSAVLYAMTMAPIAMVAALRETSIVFGALIGMFYLKESGGWRRIVAAIIIFSSVVFMAIS
jgi:drug/metabolite transporter (DMT)-like permease